MGFGKPPVVRVGPSMWVLVSLRWYELEPRCGFWSASGGTSEVTFLESLNIDFGEFQI